MMRNKDKRGSTTLYSLHIQKKKKILPKKIQKKKKKKRGTIGTAYTRQNYTVGLNSRELELVVL